MDTVVGSPVVGDPDSKCADSFDVESSQCGMADAFAVIVAPRLLAMAVLVVGTASPRELTFPRLAFARPVHLVEMQTNRELANCP